MFQKSHVNWVQRRRPIHLQSKCINATTTAAARQCPKTRQLGIVLNASSKTSHGKWCCTRNRERRSHARSAAPSFFPTEHYGASRIASPRSIANVSPQIGREEGTPDINPREQQQTRGGMPLQSSLPKESSSQSHSLGFAPLGIVCRSTQRQLFWRCYSVARRILRILWR